MNETNATTDHDGGFSGKRAADIVGITYRQLDYWARTELVRPSVADAQGSGSRRRYSFRDLLELKVIKNLLDNGFDLKKVRSVFEYLRERPDADIASANLVIRGGSVLLCGDDELVDVLKRGQGVLNVSLSLDGCRREISAKLHDPDAMQESFDLGDPAPVRRAVGH